MRRIFHLWGPAILLMAAIFIFSSIPSSELPDFNWADLFIKKGGHALGFGLLALGYWRGLGMKKHNLWVAWLFTVSYAVTDELHQIFTPGRNATVTDVLIDSLGAALALAFLRFRQR